MYDILRKISKIYKKELMNEFQNNFMLIFAQISRESIHGPCDILNAAVTRYMLHSSKLKIFINITLGTPSKKKYRIIWEFFPKLSIFIHTNKIKYLIKLSTVRYFIRPPQIIYLTKLSTVRYSIIPA